MTTERLTPMFKRRYPENSLKIDVVKIFPNSTLVDWAFAGNNTSTSMTPSLGFEGALVNKHVNDAVSPGQPYCRPLRCVLELIEI